MAVKVRTIHPRGWRVILNGRDVTDAKWTRAGREPVGGFAMPPDGISRSHVFPIDLVLGACHIGQGRVVDHFNGMLDALRITAGQLPTSELLMTDAFGGPFRPHVRPHQEALLPRRP